MVFRNIPIPNGRDEIPDGFLETLKPAYELTDDEIEAVFSGLFSVFCQEKFFRGISRLIIWMGKRVVSGMNQCSLYARIQS